jgi:hypothetical protein
MTTIDKEDAVQRSKLRLALAAAVVAALSACASAPFGGASEMTFFVTSTGPGKGGDLGGLEGADRQCQALATAVGAGNRTWRAYLSTQGSNLTDPGAINARDRIGPGPWHNAKGVLIARDVDELHSPASKLGKETALNEKGQVVNGRTEKPNLHDMLTGSRPDGTAFAGGPFPDMTCGNWTKSTKEGSAMTGHHDRAGPAPQFPWAVSWNSAHPTLGCSQEALRPTGGDGLFYCFAAK